MKTAEDTEDAEAFFTFLHPDIFAAKGILRLAFGCASGSLRMTVFNAISAWLFFGWPGA